MGWVGQPVQENQGALELLLSQPNAFDAAAMRQRRAVVSPGVRGSADGQLERSNIDLGSRPMVRNPDGSVSTVRSMSANFGDGEVLLPTVSSLGALLSADDAINAYRQTGKHLGVFDTPSNADAYAARLHDAQARFYGLR